MEAENWKAFDKASAALDAALGSIATAEEKGVAGGGMDSLKIEIDKYQKQLKKISKIMS